MAALTEGAARALDRIDKPLPAVAAAEALDYAAWACHMEDTMPGHTGRFAKASADAMELYDHLNEEG